jgi:hypothetical protein
MKMASVYLRKSIIYIHAESYTTEGALIRWPPFFKIAWNDLEINNRLNELLPKVFDGSQKGVPHPTDWEDKNNDGFYELANVRTWRQFVTGDCILVGIDLKDDEIKIFPYEKHDMGKPSVNFSRCGYPITCRQTGRLDWKFWLSMAFERCK